MASVTNLRVVSKDPEFAVTPFWDGENTPVQPDQIEKLIEHIEASLRTVDVRYHLSRKRYLVANDNLDFIRQNRVLLKKNGFVVINAPHRKRICGKCSALVLPSRNTRYPYERPFDVADRLILQEMLDQVLSDTLSPNVLLISGDSDFTETLKMLESNSYHVLLATKRDARPTFTKEATHVWFWDQMSKGTASALHK